ncbi:MAG TPA: DUF3999 family protein [Thermoanaerobaculia bacterium]|nr:DUF3999 family protein [Thermoanaerobaculia bacterium]
MAFSHERAVQPAGPGPNHLHVDVTLLAGAQPDLRDLRLYDAQGREAGYLLVTPQAEPRWIRGAMRPVRGSKFTSGFVVDLGSIRVVDRIRVTGIAPPFMKRVIVDGSGDQTRWVTLADGTVFDLPDEKLRHDEIEFMPGAYRYLQVEFDNRSSARVRVEGIEAREYDSAAPRRPLRYATPFVKRASEPGKSRYRIRLPGPRLPITHIEVDVRRGNVFRTASVTEPRLEGGSVLPQGIGGSVLKRTERDGAVAADMAIPIAAITGRELDLEIADGSNSPLDINAIRAWLLPQPWIYFESPDGASLVARYGNASLKKPSYDLEAYRLEASKSNAPRAQWGGVAGASPAGPSAPGAGAPPLGSVIEREGFRVSRKLPDAEPGLTSLLLDAHVLAFSRDLRDVRLVDGAGRQVPYLVEHRPEPLPVKLATPARERMRDGRSLYRIELPFANLPSSRLVLTTSTRVFDRQVSVRQRRGEVLSNATWRGTEPELDPPALALELPSATSRRLEILIDEGDNSPLPIESVQLQLQAKALRFTHSGTSLLLLYGNARMNAPRYDISLLAPRLFAESAHELTLAAPPGVRAADDEREGRKLFWIGVVIAAVVLILLLLRLVLVRPEPETSHAPSDTT